MDFKKDLENMVFGSTYCWYSPLIPVFMVSIIFFSSIGFSKEIEKPTEKYLKELRPSGLSVAEALQKILIFRGAFPEIKDRVANYIKESDETQTQVVIVMQKPKISVVGGHYKFVFDKTSGKAIKILELNMWGDAAYSYSHLVKEFNSRVR